jgi:hypothetical protein
LPALDDGLPGAWHLLAGRFLAPVGARRFSLVCQHWTAGISGAWHLLRRGGPACFASIGRRSIRCPAPVAAGCIRCQAPVGRAVSACLPALDDGLPGAWHLLAGRWTAARETPPPSGDRWLPPSRNHPLPSGGQRRENASTVWRQVATPDRWLPPDRWLTPGASIDALGANR